ncbi:MAG: hypothetical protein QOE14_1929 [Humisphaera sp.]|nr:hypothetical protein [Humisphaera sp.]
MRLMVVYSLITLLVGCASYATPGAGAKMDLFGATPEAQAKGTDGGIASVLDKKPLASFPASLAIVRVQAPGYISHTTRGWGGGQYSIVTLRDIEKPADLQRINALPQVRGVAPLNRLVIPAVLNSDYELRAAAARMHADILVLYTIDTVFHETDRTTPLSVVTLGATITKRLRILSTASAALLDTRTGYVYGLSEGSGEREELQNAYKTDEEVDLIRRDAETEAFKGLVSELETTWKMVLAEHARPGGATSADVYRTAPQ